MKRFTAIAIAGLSALAFGCQRDDTELSAKLDTIAADVAAIKEQLAKGGVPGRGGQQPPGQQRPRPNPTDTYSVTVAGSPTVGAADAKVTIVEAFEFA